MVIQSFLPVLGGAQRQVDLLGPLLERRGVSVDVVTRRPPNTTRFELRHGLRVRRMPGPVSGPGGSLAYTVCGATALALLRPDVVHVHDLLSPSTIALVSRPATRAPIVAKVLSTGPGGDIERLLTKPLGRSRLEAMAKAFAAFICLSGDVEEELVEHGVPRDRLHRIPNGVDVEHLRPASGDAERRSLRERHALPDGAPLALYCGRFDSVKRLEMLVQAMRGSGWNLALVGEGAEEERLRRMAREQGLDGSIAFLPKVDDPAPLYRAADTYVSASSTEGMSNSVLEAMASGLPIVTARASGMEELVGADAGVLVDADAEAFTAALSALASDPDRRTALGAGARERARGDYSLEVTADRLLALYLEVAPRR